MKLPNKIVYFLAVISLLSCCSLRKKIDDSLPQTGPSVNETKSLLMKDRKPTDKPVEKAPRDSAIPTLSKLIISPPPPVIGGEKTISFSVTEQIPLKDVLIELARVAKIDIDLDPKISGGVIINAKNRPLKEVIDRIATLGNLRYSYKNGVLYFENDTAYTKSYFVDYLIDGKLWTDVETNIISLLQSSAPKTASSSLLDSDSAAGASTQSSLTSNKSAGIISISATEKQHALVLQYLADVEKSSSAQVIIEAKLVEVILNDEFRAGIDWNKVPTNGNSSNTLAINNGGTSTPYTGTLVDVIGIGGLKASVSALEKFGTTRTLSSPRVHAINNQKAVLSFADKLVYFKVEQSQSSTTSTGVAVVATAITSTKLEEKQGVDLEITPSINLKTKEITLNIKPKITIKTSEVTDPANIINKIPVMQTRELNTIAKIQSGNALVIGGLMKESANNNTSGLPFLNRIPVLGWLFKSVARKTEITETVIFIKATVIGSGTEVTKYDRDFQTKFDSTKRPFFN